MPAANDRVKQILSWYSSDNVGVKTNLARMMNHGSLAGTGKFVILPVDQGFEHGATRSFAPNPAAYDPDYHYQLAIDAGCNAYAAPLGSLEMSADKFTGQVPLILKLNNSDTLAKMDHPCSAVTGTVTDALRLGCSAIGFTIYPGSGARNTMYEELRELILEAKEVGLPTVVWAYARGEGLSKQGETAIDVIAYAAQISCQLGAHIVKVKPPTDYLEQPEAKKVYEKYAVPIKTMTDRVKNVVQSAFNGRRIIIFSGGEARDTDSLLEDVRGIAAGGGFGSIMGRNAFQRPKAEALKLLADVMDIFRKA
jgi:class I fructose-bisphosphate aldolase